MELRARGGPSGSNRRPYCRSHVSPMLIAKWIQMARPSVLNFKVRKTGPLSKWPSKWPPANPKHYTLGADTVHRPIQYSISRKGMAIENLVHNPFQTALRCTFGIPCEGGPFRIESPPILPQPSVLWLRFGQEARFIEFKFRMGGRGYLGYVLH